MKDVHLQMIIQAGKNLSGSSCPAFWSKEGWVVEVCNDSLCLLYDWPSQSELFGITYPRISPRKNSYTSIPSRKQTNKQNPLLSKYLVHFQNWMFDCLFIYFVCLFFATYSSSTHCRTGEEYLDQNSYWSQLHCVNLRF